jgi:hypothetical protein
MHTTGKGGEQSGRRGGEAQRAGDRVDERWHGGDRRPQVQRDQDDGGEPPRRSA